MYFIVTDIDWIVFNVLLGSQQTVTDPGQPKGVDQDH